MLSMRPFSWEGGSTQASEVNVARTRLCSRRRSRSLTLRRLAVAMSALSFGMLSACEPTTNAADADTHYDARPGFIEATGDPLPNPTGAIGIRLANMLVAGPNLTICISARPGAGVAETPGHMIGTVDPARGLDGTLPYPGVSSYIPFPTYAAPGFAYVVRLYDRAALPFAALGAPCPAVGTLEPVVAGTIETASASPRTTLVAIGVVPGAPVACGASACPPPTALVIADDPTPGAGGRARVVHAIPNLPFPIHVCFDPDFVSPTENGPIPAMRVLPVASDTDGLAFGEVTDFIDVPPLSGTPGAFFVHLNAPGAPDCFAATLALGPLTLPFPVPPTAPPEVARTIRAGDVLSLFAFGRMGSPCADDAVCAPTGGHCNPAAHVCVDVLSPSVLPWIDVAGM